MLKDALTEIMVRTRALDAFRAGAELTDDLLKRTAARPAWERGGLVFMFHSVSDEPSPFRLSVRSSTFEKFCELLAEDYEVLSCAELESRRRAGALPARAIALTFDDGYADNHDVAWPILRKFGLPASVFVTAGCVGGDKLLWFQRLAHIFEKARPEALPVTVGSWTFTLDTDSERVATVERVATDMKKMSASEREEKLAAIGEALGVTDFSPLKREMLTWDQLRAMDAGGFSVEAHTMTHPILSMETIDAATREIGESREVLSAAIGRSVELFAYPNGKRKDMTDEVVAAVEHAGYRAAYAAEFGATSPANDPYRIPRVTTYSDKKSALALQIERFFYMKGK